MVSFYGAACSAVSTGVTAVLNMTTSNGGGASSTAASTTTERPYEPEGAPFLLQFGLLYYQDHATRYRVGRSGLQSRPPTLWNGLVRWYKAESHNDLSLLEKHFRTSLKRMKITPVTIENVTPKNITSFIGDDRITGTQLIVIIALRELNHLENFYQKKYTTPQEREKIEYNCDKARQILINALTVENAYPAESALDRAVRSNYDVTTFQQVANEIRSYETHKLEANYQALEQWIRTRQAEFTRIQREVLDAKPTQSPSDDAAAATMTIASPASGGAAGAQ